MAVNSMIFEADGQHTPYGKIRDYITNWAIRHKERDDYLTKVAVVNGNERTEIIAVLQYDPIEDEFRWLNDWWENEQEAELLDFCPLGKVDFRGFLNL